jgi:hypothetical protein
MDITNSIIQLHNPNKEGKHPHLTQKMKTSHMLNPNLPDKSKDTNLVILKDWKPCDLEMFASMGFSAEKSGDDGYYMEEDVLQNNDLEEQKFCRRVSRTTGHKWILEKKNIQEPNGTYRLEKVYNKLMGTDKNPGLLDYFDTLTNELTEHLYLYKSMKLKSILENLPMSKQSPPQSDITAVSQHTTSETTHNEPVASSMPTVNRGLSKEQKKMLQELVFEYQGSPPTLQLNALTGDTNFNFTATLVDIDPTEVSGVIWALSAADANEIAAIFPYASTGRMFEDGVVRTGFSQTWNFDDDGILAPYSFDSVNIPPGVPHKVDNHGRARLELTLSLFPRAHGLHIHAMTSNQARICPNQRIKSKLCASEVFS